MGGDVWVEGRDGDVGFVEIEVFVDFVGEDDDVMFDIKVSDFEQFLFGVAFFAGVAATRYHSDVLRISYNIELRLLAYGLFKTYKLN